MDTNFKIIPKVIGDEKRYIFVSKNDKLISDCFGYGFKTKYTAFKGTCYFLKKKKL